MNNSNSTLLKSNAKNFAFQESPNNYMGNFRVPATPAAQPRFPRETSTMAKALHRDNLSASGFMGGLSFTARSGEVKRSETKLTPGQSERQGRNRDSQRTPEQQLKNETSRLKATQTQVSDKQLKQHRERNCVSTNGRGLPLQRHAPYEMRPSELFDSEYLIYSL